MSDRFICQSCKIQKQGLKSVQSTLLPSMKLFMCATCIEKGFEPRFVVLLAYLDRSKTRKKLAESYITSRLYHGDVISLAETFEK